MFDREDIIPWATMETYKEHRYATTVFSVTVKSPILLFEYGAKIAVSDDYLWERRHRIEEIKQGIFDNLLDNVLNDINKVS